MPRAPVDGIEIEHETLGDRDPLIPVAFGRDTLSAIPNAEGLFLAGMGHDLPAVFHEPVVDAIDELASNHPIR